MTPVILGNVGNIMIELTRNSKLVVAASQNDVRLTMAVQPNWQEYACNNKYKLLQNMVWPLWWPLVMAFRVCKGFNWIVHKSKLKLIFSTFMTRSGKQNVLQLSSGTVRYTSSSIQITEPVVPVRKRFEGMSINY